MFYGRFYHNLDDKGRLTVPARYRELLAEGGAFVMQGFDQNLIILPTSKYESFSRHVSRMSMTDPEARLLKRLVFSMAEDVEVDRSGRILISQILRQTAKLESSVVVVGAGDYFEVWAPELWAEQDEKLQDNASNASRFAAFSIASEE